MDIKVSVNDLVYGMYINELDRPWTDTNFRFQGFELTTEEQLYELRRQCSYVMVTVELSNPVVAKNMAKPGGSGSRMERAAPKTTRDAFFSGLKNVVRGSVERLSSKESSKIRNHKPAFEAYETGSDEKATEGEKRQHLDNIAEVHEAFTPPGGDKVELHYYENTAGFEEEINASRNLHGEFCDLASDLLQNMSVKNLNEHLGLTEGLIKGVVDSMVRNVNAMSLLSRLKNMDDYSYSHAVDVSVGLVAFGRQLGFPKEQLEQLGMGGLLHDIGLTLLPEYYVKHQGIFSAEELETVKQHVKLGVDMLRESGSVSKEVIELVERHHERYDGSGYPNGLGGGNIGIFGSMAGIVDTYFTIISRRPYARARTSASALHTIFNLSGKTFHPGLTEQFIQTIGIYPIGSLVEMNTGEVGIVVRQSRMRRMLPTLLLVMDPQHRLYPDPRTVDLLYAQEHSNGEELAISKELIPGTYGIDPSTYFL
jgi:putative nucleotidyltransferase with HDIG domain